MILVLSLIVASPWVVDNVQVQIGDGRVQAHSRVVVNNGRIQAVGEQAPIPPGALVIDGKNRILTPGLIESQSQLGTSEVGMETSTNDDALHNNVFTPAFRVAEGFNANSVRIPIAREEGITSTVVAPSGPFIAGSGAWVDLGLEPHASGPIALFGGIGESAASALGGARGGIWLRLRQVLAEARFLQAHRAAVDHGDARPLAENIAQLEALAPILERTQSLILEAHRSSDILQAIDFAQKENLKIIISGATEAWRVGPQLAKAHVPVILVRPSEQNLGSFEALAVREDAAALLHHAGVTVVLSASGSDQNIRRLRQEAGTAVANGMPHQAALQAITLNAAQIYGQAKDLGSVQPGKRANLVLWSGDPFELSSIAERVWVDGEPMSLETRQKQLAKRYL